MKLILLFTVLSLSGAAFSQEKEVMTLDKFISSEKVQLIRSDLIVGENMVNMIKLAEKGYVNPELVQKVSREVSKSKNFAPFTPWLKNLENIAKLSKTSELITFCDQYTTRKETFPLERVLERVAGNFCREKALEAIGRDIDKTKIISDEASQFIQTNLKFFITKKNKVNFGFFLRSQADKPEILKKLSSEVTTYSVSHQIVPSQDVLKDILINEQITKLIQDKGFNPLQHQNVFYAEYGKLIEMGYKTLDSKPGEDKVNQHFKFLRNYLELNQDHLPLGLCLTRLNDFSKAVFRGGYKDLSRDIFKYIVKKNQKDIMEDAQFFHLWTYFSLNEFKEGLKVADSYNLVKKMNKISDPRLKFWIGFAQEKLGNKSEAIEAYEGIVSTNPLSYYSIMSTKKLLQLKPDSTVVKFYEEKAMNPAWQFSLDVNSLDADHLASLVRLRAWAKMDNQRMMNLELKRLNLHSVPAQVVKQPSDKQVDFKSDLHLVHAKLIQESKNYLATFRYLYGVLDRKEVAFNRALLEILYPKPYLVELTKALKNDSLDPLIVLALIRQESVFNPLARSPVGARGLMQLMPMTAKRLKRSVRDKHLVDPALNIELGTKYFKGLMKRYDGNLVYVLSAYNAGETRVERWKNLYFDTDETILMNIEAIPFLETRNYVKLIFRNIFFYKLLIEKKELADSGEPNKIYDVKLGFDR